MQFSSRRVTLTYYNVLTLLGRALTYFVEEKKFDKELVEKGIMSWMPFKVGQVFTLCLT